MAQPLPEEIVRRAREMYVPGAFGYKRVARELGISPVSVRRLVNEQAREKDRANSRTYKRTRTGICERCGGETRYNGHRGVVSRICATCAQTFTHCKRGHLLTPENRLPSKTGHACRICRNVAQREYMMARRRAQGIPERAPYRRKIEEMLLANQESEGAASK